MSERSWRDSTFVVALMYVIATNVATNIISLILLYVSSLLNPSLPVIIYFLQPIILWFVIGLLIKKVSESYPTALTARFHVIATIMYVAGAVLLVIITKTLTGQYYISLADLFVLIFAFVFYYRTKRLVQR